MTRFIQQCACRGSRPAGLVPERLASRPRLVSALLRDRRVARCLVAPGGYGKTAVACEYAEVVFGFRHVFWISAASPCFLRDLDAGVLASGVAAADEEAALVVLAGVPALDEARAAALSSAIDALMARGCEVMVTGVPAADCLGALQRDRLVVGAADLLVDEDEARTDPLAPFLPGAALPLEAQIPCLRWGEEGAAALARGIGREELPAEGRLALWAVLAMGGGTFEDIAALVGGVRAVEAWRFLAAHYPHAGIDAASETFRAVEVPVPVLRGTAAASADAVFAAAGRQARDELVRLAADRMVARGSCRRAAQVMGAFAGRDMVASWLSRAGWRLLWSGAGGELEGLYQAVCHGRVEGRAEVNAMMAWARAQAGDARGAIDFARKVVGGARVPEGLAAAAALAAYGRGNASTRRSMAAPVERWLDGPGAEGGDGACGALRVLASVALAPSRGLGPVACWREAAAALGEEGGADDDQVCLLAAAWALDAAAAAGAFEPGHEDEGLLASADLAALAAHVAGRLDRAAGTCDWGVGDQEAAAALERVEGALALASLPGLTERARRALDAERIRASRSAAEGALSPTSRPSRAGAFPASRPYSAALPLPGAPVPVTAVPLAPAPVTPPLLRVRLFGTMTVSLGDVDVTASLKSRKRARLLLALLVLHRGRELTRERIVSMIWPAADSRSGVKSFYRTWGELARILSVEGRCPYLARDRYGCRLNAAFCTSDVAEFESLSRQLLFGAASGSLAWEPILSRLQESFDAPLLPAEGECETVAAFRDRFTAELVDGLVAASGRLRREGEPQGALWFAREALRRDETREDVYAALMRAQMASDQRSAAVDTFFACRDFLSRALGLDPSPSLQGLYQTLLEGEALPA